MEGTVYPSRVDGWLIGLLAIAPVALLIVLVVTEPVEAKLVVLAALVIDAAAMAWLVRTTRYVVTRDEVQARCGPFRWTAPIREITAARSVTSVMSAPALSARRLALSWPGGELMVSPRNETEFLNELKRKGAKLGR
jgi:hypothetical protein